MMAPDRSVTETTVLHSVVASAQDGLLCVDPEGVVVYANDAVSELLSLAEPVVGARFDALGAAAIVHHLEHLLSGGHATTTPVTLTLGQRNLEVRFWRTRSPKLIAVAIRDETDAAGGRERAEAVLNATTDGLLVLSPADVVSYVNPAATSMLHVRPRDLLGTKVDVEALLGVEHLAPAYGVRCRDVMHCEKEDCPAYDSEDLRCWLMSGTLCENSGQVFAEKGCRCAECEVRRSNADSFDPLASDEYSQIELTHDDERRVVQVRVSAVVDNDGDYAGRVIALRDITAEHEIMQMKNEFVSTVSHELRTPLTSIKGYVDLILDGDAGEINEIQHEFLGIVKENSDRLVELINDMLDISRIESGRIHFKIEPMALDDVVEGAVDTFRAVLAQTKHKISLRVAPDMPPVAADPDRVGQVLINLISNALKYSPDGGQVSVSAKPDKDGNTVRVSVRDHGLGISREDQKHLFTKFYRVDSAMTRNIGGTGLGLSICKSIIELLGGEIGVRSKDGEGSTFWFTLPVAPPEMTRVPTVAGPEQEGGVVLVIDRDIEIATLIETYLAKRGYEVVKAHTAQQALDLAMKVQPDVITLDVILDEGDGFELIQRFKDHPETAQIPVVVLSIVCDEGRSCRFGAANYLEKPIDQQRLLTIVDDLVGATSSPLALVVDDERDVVALLSDTLRRRGFAVAQAYDGQEALAVIEQRHPDVVLLDLKMPKMDGYEVIKRIKTHPEWGDIPIVIMTAYPLDTTRLDLVDLTEGMISKPLSPVQIAETVEAMFADGNFRAREVAFDVDKKALEEAAT